MQRIDYDVELILDDHRWNNKKCRTAHPEPLCAERDASSPRGFGVPTYWQIRRSLPLRTAPYVAREAGQGTAFRSVNHRGILVVPAPPRSLRALSRQIIGLVIPRIGADSPNRAAQA